ncbi:MAG: hypothetical protein F6J93_03560 [Oscillatoria sp. SIO1A7]|nr:hypothetical protein [Oscillatoria sp. SIO1A7]
MNAGQFELEKVQTEGQIRTEQIYQLKNKLQCERIRSKSSDIDVQIEQQRFAQKQHRLAAEKIKTQIAKVQVQIEQQGLERANVSLAAAREAVINATTNLHLQSRQDSTQLNLFASRVSSDSARSSLFSAAAILN